MRGAYPSRRQGQGARAADSSRPSSPRRGRAGLASPPLRSVGTGRWLPAASCSRALVAALAAPPLRWSGPGSPGRAARLPAPRGRSSLQCAARGAAEVRARIRAGRPGPRPGRPRRSTGEPSAGGGSPPPSSSNETGERPSCAQAPEDPAYLPAPERSECQERGGERAAGIGCHVLGVRSEPACGVTRVMVWVEAL